MEARELNPCGAKACSPLFGIVQFTWEKDSRISTNGHKPARMFLVPFLPVDFEKRLREWFRLCRATGSRIHN